MNAVQVRYQQWQGYKAVVLRNIEAAEQHRVSTVAALGEAELALRTAASDWRASGGAPWLPQSEPLPIARARARLAERQKDDKQASTAIVHWRKELSQCEAELDLLAQQLPQEQPA